MMAALALATWSVQDPSLSHATDAPVRNLLGHPGAIVADLLMQLLGLGVAGAAAADRDLGLSPARSPAAQPRAAAHAAVAVRRGVGGGVRVVPAAQRALAAAVRAWRRRSATRVLRLPMVLLGVPMAGANRLAAAIVLGIAALIAFAGAAGIIWRDATRTTTKNEDDEDDRATRTTTKKRAAISLGWLIARGAEPPRAHRAPVRAAAP